MKKLNFSYEVQYTFSQPVSGHSFALRILPVTSEEQGIYAAEYQIEAGSSAWGGEERLREVTTCGVADDGFGNRVISGQVEDPHDTFRFCVTGKAYTDRKRPRKWEKHAAPMYCFATPLTRSGEKIRALFAENQERIRGEAEDMRARAALWMHLAASQLTYEPGVTDIHTTAEEALAAGSGVCQDYAHLLITLLRRDGIPARYIAGMLIGEGATHAWCEAWCDGYWIGFDPTHDRELDEDYIEIAVGRDYSDCIMDRGSFSGYAEQTQEVKVSVTENVTTPVGRWELI